MLTIRFKMKLLKLNQILFLLSVSATFAQKEAKIFTDYKNDKSILPDFSYAGYHNGEKEIPNSKDYKVFNVVDFGAKPNDNVSDKTAIQNAIAAANALGGGIVFFPKGCFNVNEDSDQPNSILSK